MTTVYISRDKRGNYIIKSNDYGINELFKVTYINYTKREALKKFRERFYYPRKHFEIIDLTN